MTRQPRAEPIPHMALQRAGFALAPMFAGRGDTDPQTAFVRYFEDDDTKGIEYAIQRHDENKAPHRWSHRVDVWRLICESGSWDRIATDVSIADALALFGQPASPQVDP